MKMKKWGRYNFRSSSYQEGSEAFTCPICDDQHYVKVLNLDVIIKYILHVCVNILPVVWVI